jgi:hypothetical protein
VSIVIRDWLDDGFLQLMEWLRFGRL